MLLLTLRGTPILYYGDELGMRDAVVPQALAQDPLETLHPLGLGAIPSARPMHWDATPNAGFTTGHPWLPLVSDWQALNVAPQRTNRIPCSRSIAVARAASCGADARRGFYAALPSPGPILGYARRLAGQPTFLVALNFSDAPADFSPEGVEIAGTIVVGTDRARDGERAVRSIHLAAHEGIVVRLDR